MSKKLGSIFNIPIEVMPWYGRFMFWKYKKVMKDVWIKR